MLVFNRTQWTKEKKRIAVEKGCFGRTENLTAKFRTFVWPEFFGLNF
jgi:hypothetical protein